MDREAYLDYIYEHTRNVQTVFNLVRTPLKGVLLDYDFYKLEDLIRNHDSSKFSEEEFDGYCQWFFNDDEKDKNKFDMAWNHHQKMNPHHWQHWIMWKPNGSIALDMPLVYVLEMLCDWAAMSRKFKNDIIDWYNKEKPKMLLSENTMKLINEHIKLFRM